jgi:hypothetical protein
MQIAMIAVEETEGDRPDLTQDSEQESLPSEGHALEDARALFTPESEDITTIIRSCLKEVRKCNSRHAIKNLCKLTAVSEYIQLRARYKKHNACKRPCLTASVAIARSMGKGPYFARQIRQLELYLKRYQHLPPPKKFTKLAHHTLLDNECILHDVRAYLAAQALGTVTPRTMSQHVNDVILPALQIKGAISESTAQRWLRFKLGYQCKESKKGLYVDGHERPDVIKERNDCIEQITNKYER